MNECEKKIGDARASASSHTLTQTYISKIWFCILYDRLAIDHGKRTAVFVQNVQICNVNSEQHDSVHIIMVVMNVVYFENCIRKIKQILCKTCGIHCRPGELAHNIIYWNRF